MYIQATGYLIEIYISSRLISRLIFVPISLFLLVVSYSTFTYSSPFRGGIEKKFDRASNL